MIKIKQATSKGYIEMCDGGVFDASYPNSKTRRGRVQMGGQIAPTITAQNSEVYRVEPYAIRMVRTEKGKELRKDYESGKITHGFNEFRKAEKRKDKVSNTLSTVQKDNEIFEEYEKGEVVMEKQYRIRKLTPIECFRLMGVSDEDSKKMLEVNSNSQCYKQAGNSIVVDVMCAMFSQLGILGVKKWNESR